MARNFGLHTRDTMQCWPQAAEEHDDWSPRRKLGVLVGLCLSAWAIVGGLCYWALHGVIGW